MKTRQCGRGPSGFTLIETLAVVAIMIILLLFAVPVLQTTLRQSKLRRIANETATLMRLARLEAIKRSCRSIVRIVEGGSAQVGGFVEGFPDCDNDCVLDADKRSLGEFPLPYGVYFLAPPNLSGNASIGGLTPVAACGAANVAVFRPDGSIETVGGFRFGDDNANFLEVWAEPQATARIEVHKCRLCTNAADRSDWYAAGAGGEAWTWN